MSAIRLWLVTCAVIIFLGACASDVHRRLAGPEKIYNTDGPITNQYHAALYYPDEVAMKYDGYIVGIEKSDRDRINANGVMPIKAIDEVLTKEEGKSKVDDFKLMFVSHIIRNNQPLLAGTGSTSVSDVWQRELQAGASCAIYNAYAYNDVTRKLQFARPCDPNQKTADFDTNQAFSNSWKAMEALQTSLEERLKTGGYTHVVVFVMGWNTVQQEAVRNFNSLAKNLIAAYNFNEDDHASKENFKPLFIGVTWPSQWNSAWADPLTKLFSFSVKASDADEVGLTWLGVLLHQTIPASINKQKVIVVGHSFGARATSVAACVGPVILQGVATGSSAQSTDTSIPRGQPVDTLVNFQGAYLIGRLTGNEKDRGFHYPVGCPAVKNFVLTASVHDAAVSAARWGSYVGRGSTYEAQCGKDVADKKMNCATVASDGKIQGKSPGKSNVTYVEASSLIYENAYETGGGAHSDIYRREHGIFIRQAIEIKD